MKYKPSAFMELVWAAAAADKERRIIHTLRTLTPSEMETLSKPHGHASQLACDRLVNLRSRAVRDDVRDHVAGCHECFTARLRYLSEEKAAHDEVCDSWYCVGWWQRCPRRDEWGRNVGAVGFFNRERHAHAIAEARRIGTPGDRL